MKNSNGQSLFELIAAVAVIAITLTALISLATQSVSDSSTARNRTQASRLTQEAVEWLRNERDTNWIVFTQKDLNGITAGGSDYCLVGLNWTVNNVCTSTQKVIAKSGEATTFTRNLTVTILSVAEVEVDVKTEWEDSSGVHNSRATIVLTDFRSF